MYVIIEKHCYKICYNLIQIRTVHHNLFHIIYQHSQTQFFPHTTTYHNNRQASNPFTSMNSYTFVPKLHHLTSQHANQPASSLKQRLNQLKSSINPAYPSQQQYSSIPHTTNPSQQYGSAAQNQRLFQYLPQQTQQRLSSKPNDQGTQQYESYRRSLEKKLNYLFEKEKHIMKTQSTFQRLRGSKEGEQGYKVKAQTQKRQYTDELERKYGQLKQQQQKAINDRRPVEQPPNLRALSPQTQDHRQYKVHSTIETNCMTRPFAHTHKDQEIDQMQRKIKILEMKYLGTYSQPGLSSTQYEIQNSRGQKIALSGISQILPKNNQKSTKVKQKKEKTSPDRTKNKLNQKQHQTIQHPLNAKHIKNNKQNAASPGNQKHTIKDYMNTIEHQASQQNQQAQIQAESILHKEFSQLKKQFRTLLEISKSMIEKVQTNEEQKMAKRQRKLRAKAMLKEILLRLDEIKFEMQGQANRGQMTFKSKFSAERVKAKSDCEPRFQKSSHKALEKKTIHNLDANAPKSSLFSHKKSIQNDDLEEANKPYKSPENHHSQVEKLKRLLTLQVEHRQLMQRKLQVVYNHEILAQNQ